jgi:hypothetical protein
MLIRMEARAVTRMTTAADGEERRPAQSRRGSIMRYAVHSRTPAKAACGMARAAGANSSKAAAKATAENTPDNRVAAPA